MTQIPPDEQLRHLLERHDRLLAETAQQNRELHEWAVRFGPRPVQTMPAPTYPPPSNPPQLSWATEHPPLVVPVVQQEPPEPTKPSLSNTQIIARLVAGAGALVTLVGIAFILVLAAQYGYFGPAPRTISAAGLGVA